MLFLLIKRRYFAIIHPDVKRREGFLKADPRHVSLDVHRVACHGLLVASQKMTETCLRLLAEQQRTLASISRNRRAEDGGGRPSAASNAADLQYCYGRRCHDVDVERL